MGSHGHAGTGRLGRSADARGALWARVWLGGFAAVAVLYPLRPEGLISLVSLSVIAGSMGTALFKILHDRVLQLARTARLGAALAANESMLRDIHKTAQEGAASVRTSNFEATQSPAAESAGGAGTLSLIASMAAAGVRTSEGALTATHTRTNDADLRQA